MTTPLGGGAGGGVTVAVVNVHATVTIAKGRLVSADGAATLDQIGSSLSQKTFLYPVTPFDGNNNAGVTVAAIAPGQIGVMVTQGPVFIETNGSVVGGSLVEPSGVGGDASAGLVAVFSAGEECGLALQTDFQQDTSDFIADGSSEPTYALVQFDTAFSPTAVIAT